LRLCQHEGDVSYPEEAKPSPKLLPRSGPTPPKKKKIQLKMTSEIYLLLGMIHEEQGRPSEALECMKTAMALKPFDSNTLKNMAIALINRNEIDEAARLLQRVVKLSPQDFQSRLLLEQAQTKRRRPDTAAKVAFSKEFLSERDVRFQYVFENNPGETADKVNFNAMELIKEGLVLDAARWLQRFVEIYEDSPTIFYNLGQLYNSLGHYADALKYGIKAVELKKDYRDAYDLAGNVCFKIREFESSVRLYEEAVHLDTKDPMSYYNLGCAYNELGNLASAEKNWLEAIRLENAPALAGDASNAGTDVLKIAVRVKVEPISALACQSLAFFYAGQGKKENALAYFKKAIEFNPAAPIPYFEIGKLYFEQNEAGKAQDYFKKYVSLGGDEAKVKALVKK
jgi:tetratricopeptide (TPR) repeat protein